MNRDALLQGALKEVYEDINQLHVTLGKGFRDQFNRSLPFTDELFDRWERAKKLGFGEGSSIYDSSYVFGDVVVGKNTWIGPFTMIDGSGGLQIGDNCTISASVHIYSHDNVMQTITGGKQAIQRKNVSIGSCTYIGPHAIISKGITIGDHCIIGAGSFVNKSVPSFSVVFGTPARVTGNIVLENDSFRIEYFK